MQHFLTVHRFSSSFLEWDWIKVRVHSSINLVYFTWTRFRFLCYLRCGEEGLYLRSQAFPVFVLQFTFSIIHKLKSKNRGGLGIRLEELSVVVTIKCRRFVQETIVFVNLCTVQLTWFTSLGQSSFAIWDLEMKNYSLIPRPPIFGLHLV